MNKNFEFLEHSEYYIYLDKKSRNIIAYPKRTTVLTHHIPEYESFEFALNEMKKTIDETVAKQAGEKLGEMLLTAQRMFNEYNESERK